MLPKLYRGKILTSIALLSFVAFIFLHLKHLNTLTSVNTVNTFLINKTVYSNEYQKNATFPDPDFEPERLSIVSSDLDREKFRETCHTLMSGDASNKMIKNSIDQSEHRFVYNWITNNTLGSCDQYLNSKTIPFIQKPVDQMEEEFPLAFAILVYHNFLQLEQLFRVLYRPQNFYCIHIDASAKESFKQLVQQMADCFPDNVFLASKPVDVKHGFHSVLLAEFSCMSDLIRMSKKWKYYINLTGEEFPLVTNLELVSFLRRLHGINIIDGAHTYVFKDRLPKVLPMKLNKYKGSTHFFLNYKAIEFALTANISHYLNVSLAPFRSTCESFFQVLQFNPQVNFPGGMSVKPDRKLYNDTGANRHKDWQNNIQKCITGKIQREICMLGVQYLPKLTHESYGRKLVANKFPWKFHPLAWDCMLVWHHEKVKKEYLTGKPAVDFEEVLKSPYVKYGRTVEGF